MKKLIGFIKAKEREEKPLAAEKKANLKEEKNQSATSREHDNTPPRDLFWDDYSDVGYC
jgi:hypothetical protein